MGNAFTFYENSLHHKIVVLEGFTFQYAIHLQRGGREFPLNDFKYSRSRSLVYMTMMITMGCLHMPFSSNSSFFLLCSINDPKSILETAV